MKNSNMGLVAALIAIFLVQAGSVVTVVATIARPLSVQQAALERAATPTPKPTPRPAATPMPNVLETMPRLQRNSDPDENRDRGMADLQAMVEQDIAAAARRSL